jgi:thioredoxin
MKKINNLIYFSIVFSLMSCLSANKNKENKVEQITSGGEVVVLNKADFLAKVFNYEKNPETWLYEGDKPCIVDFYADWCGPCKKVSPILRDLAVLYKNDIVVYKVDVDSENELAAAFGIQSIPTLLFIPKDGDPQVSLGALPREELVKQIDSYLLGRN